MKTSLKDIALYYQGQEFDAGLSLAERMENANKKEESIKKQSKEIFESLWNAFRRGVSFFDLFADIRLLYLSSSGGKVSLTIFLSLSIICPYIISYSCDIKLFMINNERWNRCHITGLHKLLMYFRASPVGVLFLYF